VGLIEELEQDHSLDEPDRLRGRVEALERLEAYLLADSIEAGIHHQARALYARLEAANFELYKGIRGEIQRGAGREALLQGVHDAAGLAQGEGYDYLDELIIGVLQFEEPGGVVPLGAEMVFYQPTPARRIFDLIRRTALTERDVLVDLGSGLGHVPLLASICTNARSIGIELEPAYIDCSRQSAAGLNLNNVTFLQQDARAADLSVGTVFYLYTPFTGAILRAVLDSLQQEAARRQIRVCTFGPCTPTVGEEQWLEGPGALYEDRVAVFCSRN
jgi:Histone methylation protein DOT1